MKAAVYAEYGPPDVVQIAEVETPVAKDDEVLVEVHAASLNPYDWHFVRGLSARITSSTTPGRTSRRAGDATT
jgi:NADPH:quinone reductase-like Zn-dependent oxidoreductase